LRARRSSCTSRRRKKKAYRDVWAISKTIGEIEKRGTEALAVRVEAYTGVSREALRIQTWKENANAARRGGCAGDMGCREREAAELCRRVLPGGASSEEEGPADLKLRDGSRKSLPDMLCSVSPP
jgi:hypothetical protein